MDDGGVIEWVTPVFCLPHSTVPGGLQVKYSNPGKLAEMALLAEKAVGYFSSIGPLAKKILDDQENLRRQYGSEWNRLSSEKQDCLVDQFFIDEEVLEKYQVAPGDDDEERPDCFPKLKIPCGEKICVDFDNDVSRKSNNNMQDYSIDRPLY